LQNLESSAMEGSEAFVQASYSYFPLPVP
jgi:hypothetical protein